MSLFSFFKFHYVSINSALAELSIYLACYPLNSIMFLLILISLCCCVGFHPNFKFHYVSINSASPLMLFWSSFTFKFHYVSINSAPVHPSLLCPKSLNSIMFLLIPQPFRDRAHNVYPFKFHYVSINSIVYGCNYFRRYKL